MRNFRGPNTAWSTPAESQNCVEDMSTHASARCSDGPEWEDLARRALAVPPPYRPVPGAPIYQVNLDGDREVLVAEHDLRGPLLDLVTALLAMGEEVLARPGTHGLAETA